MHHLRKHTFALEEVKFFMFPRLKCFSVSEASVLDWLILVSAVCNKLDSPQYNSSSLLSQAMVIADSGSLGTLTSLATVRQVTGCHVHTWVMTNVLVKTSGWFQLWADPHSRSGGADRLTHTRGVSAPAATHTCARYAALRTHFLYVLRQLQVLNVRRAGSWGLSPTGCDTLQDFCLQVTLIQKNFTYSDAQIEPSASTESWLIRTAASLGSLPVCTLSDWRCVTMVTRANKAWT